MNRFETIQYATGCLDIVEAEIDFTLYVVTRPYAYESKSLTESRIRNITHNANVACKLLMKEDED
jgi:hypothetical protein